MKTIRKAIKQRPLIYELPWTRHQYDSDSERYDSGEPRMMGKGTTIQPAFGDSSPPGHFSLHTPEEADIGSKVKRPSSYYEEGSAAMQDAGDETFGMPAYVPGPYEGQLLNNDILVNQLVTHGTDTAQSRKIRDNLNMVLREPAIDRHTYRKRAVE